MAKKFRILLQTILEFKLPTTPKVVWFVIAPVGADQGSALNPKIPSNSKIVSATVGSPQYNAWVSNGSYHGWQVVMGPFGSKQLAEKAVPPSGLNAVGQIAGAAGQLAKTTPAGAIGIGAVSGVAGLTGDVFKGLNLGSWFLRIGEILLGLVLIGVGIARITGIQNVVSDLAKTKIPIPL